MDKSKLVLSVTILLASVMLGGFYYVTQVNKQQSIERQQEIKLQHDKKTEEVRTEQKYKEYVAKRKNECYAIYEKEREEYNNVENFGYVETYNVDGTPDYRDDTCEIIYKNNEWRENDPNSCNSDNLFNDESSNCTINKYFRKYF